MFTQNYIDWQNLVFISSSKNAYITAHDGTRVSIFRFISNSQNDTTLGMSIPAAMQAPVCQSPGSSQGLYFGTGTTPATKSNYTLESPITSGLSFTSKGTTVVGAEETGKYVASVSHNIKNTSESTISISEIGLFGRAYATSSSAYVLLERTVLSEPIILGAGEEKIITYKITFNQTSA